LLILTNSFSFVNNYFYFFEHFLREVFLR